MSRLGRRRVVTKWLTSTPESRRADLEGWLDDLFYRALAWVVGARAFVVETTLVGTVTNGLSALIGAESRAGFVTGLVRGLGGNLGLADRAAFAKEVFAWAGERPPDAGAPLDCDVDPGTGALYGFSSRCGGVAGGQRRPAVAKPRLWAELGAMASPHLGFPAHLHCAAGAVPGAGGDTRARAGSGIPPGTQEGLGAGSAAAAALRWDGRAPRRRGGAACGARCGGGIRRRQWQVKGEAAVFMRLFLICRMGRRPKRGVTHNTSVSDARQHHPPITTLFLNSSVRCACRRSTPSRTAGRAEDIEAP